MSESYDFPEGFEMKPDYPFACPVCGDNIHRARVSMAMQMGMNSGHGTCTQCGSFLHLSIDLESNECINATLWSDYIARRYGVQP